MPGPTRRPSARLVAHHGANQSWQFGEVLLEGVTTGAGIPCGAINNIAQAIAHPQAAARNMVISVDDPVTGPLQLAGNPMKLSGFADPSTRSPAPELDADRTAILRELGL